MTKSFDYQTVATVVADLLFDDHDKVQELIAYMTGRPVTRDNEEALMRVCRAWFLNHYPALGSMDFAQCSPFYYDCYAADFEDILGLEVPVPEAAAAIRGAV